MTDHIYMLHAPRDIQGHVYVGKSDDPHTRHFEHLVETYYVYRRRKKKSPKNRWLYEWTGAGVELVILEEVPEHEGPEAWRERERWWIAYMRGLGFRMLNSTPGGEGGHAKKRKPRVPRVLKSPHRKRM